MKPNGDWIKNWAMGIDPEKEARISKELLTFFQNFWVFAGLDEKSKTTINRYSNALFSLGGFLVKESVSEFCEEATAEELLQENISPYEGPLVFHHDEDWQNQLDMVCRKIYQYMQKMR